MTAESILYIFKFPKVCILIVAFIAECAEVQHHTITCLVRDNKADFEALRILGFKIHKLDKRGQPKKSIF